VGYYPQVRTKSQAEARLQEIIVASGVNKPDYLEKILKPATTFNDVADQWEQKRLPELAATTRLSLPCRLRKFIRPYFGHMTLESIRTAQVNDFIRGLTVQGLKPKTILNTYKDLRSIVNWYRQELDQPKICWYAKLPKLTDIPPRWFTPQEVDMLVNAAHGQYCVFFRLAGYSGMRCGELTGLKVEDINFDRALIHIRRSTPYGERTKTPAGYRTVYLDPVTLEMLRQHLNGRRAGLVFQSRLGTPLRNGEINRGVLKPLCAKLGIPRGTLHAFRHGRVSLMVASRLRDKFIQSQVGQVDTKITNHYTHFADEQNHHMVKEAVRCGQNSGLWSTVN
jgi:integrase